MKNALLSLLFAVALTTNAFSQGKVAPYTYTWSGSPVDVSTDSINPPAGSVVIDIVTGTHYRKISAIGSNATYAVESTQTVTASTPLTGATISASTSQTDEFIYITPAGTIAALTITFPSNANSHLGQRLTLLSTQIVTALTVSASAQTVTTTTALAANVPAIFIKTAASTWTRISNAATVTGVAITTPVITTGLTASGSAANDFSASTGTFLTSSGANTLSGAVTIADATTPSLTTAAGKTNTGFVTVSGKTSGAFKILPVDAAVQTVTLSLAAQTSGAATLTIADLAGTAASLMTSALTTNTRQAANSVTGVSNGLEFEGSTADAFETTLTLTDPTADQTITFPNGTGSVMLTSLATNVADAANAVTGMSNGLLFEGATADAFEGTLTVADVTADRTWTFPDRTGSVRLSQSAATPALSADDQAVTPGADNYIAFTSDNTTATNRTFTLSATGAVTGQMYVITDNVANATGRAEIASTGIQKLNGTMSFDAQYDSLTVIFDGTNFVELARTHR